MTSLGVSALALSAGTSKITSSSSRRTRTTPPSGLPTSIVSTRVVVPPPVPNVGTADVTFTRAAGGSRPRSFGAPLTIFVASRPVSASAKALPGSCPTLRSVGFRMCHPVPRRASSIVRPPASIATSSISSGRAPITERSTSRLRGE
ncbi:MAG: hypothetical protein U0235_35100 [Polyangiaceae bacterium]